jgi:hypothetical protein
VPYAERFEGSGSPDGIIAAWPGCTYCDRSINKRWVKIVGSTVWGWYPDGGSCTTLGGGDGSANIYYIAGDPNGILSAEWPAIAYGPDNSVWIKVNQGNNSQGWQQVVAGWNT